MSETANAPCAAELKNVSKTYKDFWGRPVAEAVRGLDLEVPKGGVFGLLGPNGSGKSTTIKMILGLVRPDNGAISVSGHSPRSVEARRLLGYLPELSYLHPFLTARETLRYYAGLCALDRKTARERIAQLLEMTCLEDVADRPVGGFSKGMARRVALASALVGKPSLLVMDEPTSGLDPVSTSQVKTLVKALSASGMTVVMSSHLLADAQDVCTRVCILDKGRKAAEGDVASIGSSLEEYFLAKIGDAGEFKVAEFLG